MSIPKKPAPSGSLSVVIDKGSYVVKAGFGGGSEPKAVFPNLIACDNEELTLRRVFEEQLGIPSEGQTVLITDHLLSSKESREKTAEILFKTLKVDNVFIAYDAVLALYATGRQEGVVVDIGHRHAYAVPVVKGFAVHSAVAKSEINGEAVDKYLAAALREKGHAKAAQAGKMVRDIKERFCIVASDAGSIGNTSAKLYMMPDGKQAETIVYEWAKAPEILFNPNVAGLSGSGVQELIHKAISGCEEAVQTNLWNNIVLSSGSVMFPGFSERLQAEVLKIAPAGTNPKVIYANPSFGTWIGGSILVSLPQMADMFVTKEEYAKQGAVILHKKCL